ncbi:GNAT family N-acetyltransferase [Roseovarius sp. D22-M7]|uniref:GNAT family N-acetyltransferase n=1 Tax=Roseovarius sp. D22-M7 TaxID=3127116 RepID=UPI00301043B1
MTPEAIAETHARAFDQHGRPWSAQEFQGLLQDRHVICTGDARAFLLGRVVADEAEILTLATDPAHRRRGLARACLRAFHAQAAARGATQTFLEVAADNAPARALYTAARYVEVGRRNGYYGAGVDALLLSRPLSQAPR